MCEDCDWVGGEGPDWWNNDPRAVEALVDYRASLPFFGNLAEKMLMFTVIEIFGDDAKEHGQATGHDTVVTLRPISLLNPHALQ